MKHVYGKDAEFEKLTNTLGKIRLQYHLTNKAWLLPPNMRSIARFMNLQEWVKRASKMLDCYNSLEGTMKEVYAFLLPYRKLVEEINVCVDAIRQVEDICKHEGFGKRTYALCKDYIIRNVIGNANSRRARLGMEMIKYFDRQCELLKDDKVVHQISSDSIESDFDIYKAKKAT